ncbi:hypothetical protein HanRHA438_Chr06g0277191 [Helianthus annuus]|nr:hypothetical protein HanRHA438_Chr06g0277191 [Helianthus annuus]
MMKPKERNRLDALEHFDQSSSFLLKNASISFIPNGPHRSEDNTTQRRPFRMRQG